VELNGSPQQIRGMQVTPSWFNLLRVSPALGRAFTREEGEIGADQEVILSHGLWQQLYAGDKAALGRDLRISGRPFKIVGVMPPDFTFIEPEVRLWLPLAFTDEQKTVHHSNNWYHIGRLKPGATLQQAQGTLERDQNILAEAKMDLERYQVAWSKNAIPRQTLEDQEKVVLQEQGTVKNDEGVVKFDQVQLGYCHITSPITGRVGLRLVDPGNLVTANSTTTLLVVTEMQPITVVFTLAEDNLPQVLQHSRGKQQLKVEVFDRTNEGLLDSGKLTSIDNQIDTTTGTVKLRAEFANKKGVLFPNQFVNTRMLVSTLPNQVLIPSSAIQHNGNVDFVYVINNNKAEQRNVKSGISDNGETAVEGVKAGEVVANSSFEKLQNGSQTTLSKIKLPTTSDAPTSSAP